MLWPHASEGLAILLFHWCIIQLSHDVSKPYAQDQKKKTYAQSQNLTSPGLSADCDGLALEHPHMHSRVSSRTGWTSWPTENTLSRIRRTQLPVRWKKSFLLCMFSTFYSNSACASLEELIMFVLSCSRALYFTASSSKQTAFYVETQLHLWRNFLQFNP